MNCDMFWSRSEKGIFVIFFHKINSLEFSKKPKRRALKDTFLDCKHFLGSSIYTQYPLYILSISIADGEQTLMSLTRLLRLSSFQT